MVDLATLEFQGAIWSAVNEKDNRPLTDLLRANYPLTAGDKLVWADFLDGKRRRPRGRRPWRATDEIFLKKGRAQAAVQRAAFYIKAIKKAARDGKRSSAGIHRWAVEQVLEHMKEKGFRLPDSNSLENYLRRSKRRATKAQP
jgi:hypothetical protein